MDNPIKITENDQIKLCEDAEFITRKEYFAKCRVAGLADRSPSAFADEYGYTAVIAVERNGVSGWACFS